MKNNELSIVSEGWEHIGTSPEGQEFYLPLKYSVIKRSKEKLKEIANAGAANEKNRSEYDRLNKILDTSLKRKLRINWVFVIVNILFLVLWYYMADLNEPMAGWIKNLEGEELVNMQHYQLAQQQKGIAYHEENIPINEDKLSQLKSNPHSSKKKIKKAQEYLQYEYQAIDESNEYIASVSKMTPEEFKQFTIKREKKDRIEDLSGFSIWIIALILYFVTNRRPMFLIWKKNKNNGLFETPDTVLGTAVLASTYNSLINFDRNSVVFTKWSDGLTTRSTDLTAAGGNIILGAVVLLFYMMFLIMSLPVRVVINFFRNFVLYV